MSEAGAQKKICVFTGTRAEYGLLRWVMADLHEAPDVRLQILVSGTHLSPEFGLTYREIEDDGFTIDERVEMLLSSDTAVGVTKSLGMGTIGFADALNRLRPDLLVVLGDRYEALAAVQAAMLARIPIAHVHGGESSEGAVDEAIRHAITKMAHLHFAAAEPFARRIVQLGEQPERVHVTGAPGIDVLTRTELIGRRELEASLGTSLGSPTLLVTYHPATLGDVPPAQALEELLAALDGLPEASVVFTRPNADAASRGLAATIDRYAAAHAGRVSVHTSLGHVRYLSLLREADVVVGNSSSGLIEAPAVGTPTVNIGPRQRGRLRAASVIDCEEERGLVLDAIRRALTPEFKALAADAGSPYGDGHASARIAELLRSAELGSLLAKRFFEVDVVAELDTAAGGL